MKFDDQVLLTYQVYNGLFQTLPFSKLKALGVELPSFTEYCKQGLAQEKSPAEIVEAFFTKTGSEEDLAQRADILFIFLQFIERQIVLFDAIEDNAFPKLHDLQGDGTLSQLLNHARQHELLELKKILTSYRTRIVLTAHPTQFYPAQVLGIIQDLTHAMDNNDLKLVRDLLLQLGKTPFRYRTQPTPLTEARVIIYQLEHMLYPAIKEIQFYLQEKMHAWFAGGVVPSLIEIGFWPCGDRDGNPNVTVEATLDVARLLKVKIIGLYIEEIQALRRHLTFRGVWTHLGEIQKRLLVTQHDVSHIHDDELIGYANYQELIDELLEVKQTLLVDHDGLFMESLDKVLCVIRSFGFYFASLDVRQNSDAHAAVIDALLAQTGRTGQPYLALNPQEKLTCLQTLLKADRPQFDLAALKDEALVQDSLGSLAAIRDIQQENGEAALHRYVISNTHGAHNILEVMLLAYWANWPLENLRLDIVPLFESVDDLKRSRDIMETLIAVPFYREHLKRRGNTQTVMLGFSDGTKDGGYVMANWLILQCKQDLSLWAQDHAVDILFFDGRGGPPARGGGNTYKFYRAMGEMIPQRQVQLTIQGQTISSKFGTEASAKFNLEQLASAGIEALLYREEALPMDESSAALLAELADEAYQSYEALKQHPCFLGYLEEVTPLHYYGKLNIASRPPRRSKDKPLTLDDLRAISFVGAWSQMKQNVPGFYGLGTALKALVDAGKLSALRILYQRSLYFRTLLENAMQALLKSNFAVTHYLANDEHYGEFWSLLREEAALTEQMLKQVTEQNELLATDPLIRRSIVIREGIIQPLLVIQQYALFRLRLAKTGAQALSEEEVNILSKIVLKSLPANINASRNSA